MKRKQLEEMLQEQKRWNFCLEMKIPKLLHLNYFCEEYHQNQNAIILRLVQKQSDRIAELEEDNNIYAEEVTNIAKANRRICCDLS